MPANPQFLIDRFNRLRAIQANHRSAWQEIAELMLPRKSSMIRQRSPGQKQTERLFDSTAIESSEKLASTLHASMSGKDSVWFSLKPRRAELAEEHEVTEWLEACRDILLLAYEQSNLASELAEVYLDLSVFGGATVLQEELGLDDRGQWQGLNFTAVTLGDRVIDEDARGRVDTVIRAFTLSARAAFDRWGEKIGAQLVTLKTNKPEQPCKFLHAVYPRPKSEVAQDATRRADAMPWASCYVALDGKILVEESGYEEMPYACPRWAKSTGEMEGRGPGHTALPDVQTLNKADELSLRQWSLAVAPPTKSLHDGVVGAIQVKPAGNTVVREADALSPLFPGGMIERSLDAHLKMAEAKRATVRRIFYADMTEIFTQKGAPRTAFEVAKAIEWVQRLLGPVTGRIQRELLGALIDRSFAILLRRNQFPEPPGILLRQGADIDVEYEGPLARAQKMGQVEAIERLIAGATSIAQFKPDIIDRIDWDEALLVAAEIGGVPERIIRSEAGVTQIRQDRAQAKQQAEGQQSAALAAESLGKAAPALALLGAGGGNGAQ